MTLDSGVQMNSPVQISASPSEQTGSGWTTVHRCRFSVGTVSLRALSLDLNRNCFYLSVRLKLARPAPGPDRAVSFKLTFTLLSNVFPAVASKVCAENGEWGRHPESNRTWTDFTNCRANSTSHQMVSGTLADTGPGPGPDQPPSEYCRLPVAGSHDSFLPGDDWPRPLAGVAAHISNYFLLF